MSVSPGCCEIRDWILRVGGTCIKKEVGYDRDAVESILNLESEVGFLFWSLHRFELQTSFP